MSEVIKKPSQLPDRILPRFIIFPFSLYSNELDDNEHTSTGAPLAIEQKIDSEIILPRPRSRNAGNTLTKKMAA